MSYLDRASVPPYSDDFNADLNFLRVMFVPGRSVQARELTQAQTILQNQISSVGSHLFRNNSTVLGAKISVNPSKPAVKLYNLAVSDRETGALSGISITSTYPVSNFIGRTFQNTDPGAGTPTNPTKKLKVTHAHVFGSADSEIVLYFTFSGAAPVADELFFDSAGSSGIAIKVKADMFLSMAAISEPGIVYRSGHFIQVVAQEVIVGKGLASDDLHACVGYRFEEDIVTESDQFIGNLLLDPSAGFYNSAAPGAHRYRVTPVLDSYLKENESELDTEFVEKFASFLEVKSRKVIRDQTDTQYGKILDLLARRTYDESGNYTVKNFDGIISDHPSDDDKLNISLSPGKAYVLGYEVKTLTSSVTSMDKAREYATLNSTYALAGDHFYFVVRTSNANGDAAGTPLISGLVPLSSGSLLYCYDQGVNTAGTVISRANCTKIGEARVHSLVKVGSEWRLYVSNADSSLANNFASVSSFRDPTSTPGTNEPLVVVSAGFRTASYTRPVGGSDKSDTDRVVDVLEESIPPSYSGQLTTPLLMEVNGATVVKSLIPNESSFSYMQTRTGVFSGSTVVTFTGQSSTVKFFSESEDGVALLLVDTVGSDLPVNYTRIYPSEFVTTVNNSTNPATITITVSGARAAGFAGKKVTAILKHEQAEAPFRQKTLQTFTQTLSSVALTTDLPVLLTKEDGYRLVSARQLTNIKSGLNSPHILTAAQLALLTFDSGQKDWCYDRASVKGFRKLGTFGNPSTPTDFELVYEYFEHSSVGVSSYFCVNSYPFDEDSLENIPSYKSTSGQTYDLVNCVDFRSKLSEIAGKFYPVPLSRFRNDAEVYLPRIDKVYVDALGQFGVIKGIPSFTPEAPPDADNAMTLYVIRLNPYTYDRRDLSMVAIDNRRYTMRDIGRIDTRVRNLETLTSLTLLEQSAVNMSIVDALGFDRFKSGIFADPLKGHNLADIESNEYRIAMDQTVGGGRCPFESKGYTLLPVAGSYDTRVWSNLVTLEPIAQEIMASNLYASSSVNVNPYLFFVWNGTVVLRPSVDTWFETEYAPEIRNDTGQPPIPQPSGVYWNDWQNNWVGQTTITYSNPILVNGGTGIQATATTTTTQTATTQTATGVQIGYVPTTSITVGERIIDTSSIPYMRPITVSVAADGMRQGMPIKAYFDGFEVTLTAEGSNWIDVGSGRPKIDNSGQFRGSFSIPAGTITTGTKGFTLVDDANTSSGTTTFTSSGILETRQQTITTVRGVEEVRTIVSQTQPLTNPISTTTSSTATIWLDPIAQSFLVDSPGGAFLSSIEVFFRKKPTNPTDIEYLPITLYIVSMENGYPTQKIIPFSKVTLSPGDVSASETPSEGSTIFQFSDPIYVEDGTEYAVVLFSNSRGYEAWTSVLGEQDRFSESVSPVPIRNSGIRDSATRDLFREQTFITSDGQVTASTLDEISLPATVNVESGIRGTNIPGTGIAEQPYLGSFFRSQNSSTWTADQMTDLTFRIRKFLFPISSEQTIVFRDSKVHPNGTSIYGPIFPAIQSNKVAISMANVGDLILPGTSISYAQSFHAGPSASFVPIVNRENIQLPDEAILDNALNAAARNNYSLRASMKTSKNTITPVIDLQQLRMVGIRYLVSETDLSYDETDPLSELDSGVYDAGTYVSKSIKLLKRAGDLRVIVDAQLAGGGFLEVFYKTTESAPIYFDSLANTVASQSLVGKNCRLLYRKASDDSVGDPNVSAPVFSGQDIRCLVTRVDDGLNPDRVFIRSVTESSKFLPYTHGTLVAAIDKTFIVPEAAAEEIAAGAVVKVPDWDVSENYTDKATKPQFVFHAGRLWKVGPEYGGAGFEPAVGGVAWIVVPSAVLGTAIATSASEQWKPMKLEAEPNPDLNPESRSIEYTYLPEGVAEEFGTFSVKVDMYSRSKALVPIIRNFRTIAVI
jgi:hypothetical protein